MKIVQGYHHRSCDGWWLGAPMHHSIVFDDVCDMNAQQYTNGNERWCFNVYVPIIYSFCVSNDQPLPNTRVHDPKILFLCLARAIVNAWLHQQESNEIYDHCRSDSTLVSGVMS